MALTKSDFMDLWKPSRPLATDSWADGQFRMSRDNAIKKRFIETTPKTYKNLMVLDVDEEDASWFIKGLEEDDLIPEPSYMTINPSTSHAQIGYFIEGYVGTPKGIAYFNDVFENLKFNSGTDLAYGGRSMRNPLSELQQTQWGSDHLYTLAEIKPFCKRQRPPRKAQELTGGRTIDTFNALRQYAYTVWRKASTPAQFEALIWARALEINYSWAEPLKESELRSIVNSVSRWINKHFNKATYSKKQAYRVNLRWKKTEAERERRKTEVLLMLEAGMKVKDIAENYSISYEAAKSMVRRVKNISS